jgi:TatD DNase family protein
VIDSHCHLAGEEFAADLEAVVARAREAGLVRCLVVLSADDDAEVDRAADLERLWPDVQFAVGVHPHQAGRFAGDAEDAARLTARRLDRMPAARAVGEIGLDFHGDFAPRDVQHAVFRAQLRLARERALPVVIHTREAEDDTLRLIAEASDGRLRGVFHCFTGSPDAARRALATGFHVSLPGILTFPRADTLRDAARVIPLDRLLVETDSPYLAPVPHRGSRNEPAYVTHVIDTLAALRGVDRVALDRRLVANFDTLFGGPICVGGALPAGGGDSAPQR